MGFFDFVFNFLDKILKKEEIKKEVGKKERKKKKKLLKRVLKVKKKPKLRKLKKKLKRKIKKRKKIHKPKKPAQINVIRHFLYYSGKKQNYLSKLEFWVVQTKKREMDVYHAFDSLIDKIRILNFNIAMEEITIMKKDLKKEKKEKNYGVNADMEDEEAIKRFKKIWDEIIKRLKLDKIEVV
jgi:hypothetical protein